jgi:hypothetical protein
MDDFAAFVFSASAGLETPGGGPDPPPARGMSGPEAARPKPRAVDLTRYTGLLPIAATLLVLSTLGMVALADRRAARREPSGETPLPGSRVVPLGEEDEFARWVIAEHHRTRMRAAGGPPDGPRVPERGPLPLVTASLRELLGPEEEGP